MPKKGKGKKKGKKKGDDGPEILTTQEILEQRAVAMCPRLGDHYEKQANVEHILEVNSCILFSYLYIYDHFNQSCPWCADRMLPRKRY